MGGLRGEGFPQCHIKQGAIEPPALRGWGLLWETSCFPPHLEPPLNRIPASSLASPCLGEPGASWCPPKYFWCMC